MPSGVQVIFKTLHAVDPLACERFGGCFHRIFVISAFAQDKKFHQFARKVFVRGFFIAVFAVEIAQHGRIAQDVFNQGFEISKPVFTQH